MNSTILIDGDILTYKVAFSVETPIYVVKNGVYKTKATAEAAAKRLDGTVFKRINVGSEQELKSKLKVQMKQIFEDLGGHQYKMFITSPDIAPNFRDRLATIVPYKENRTKSIKPVHYKRIREILVKEWDAIEVGGQEADDQLAIEQISAFKTYGSYEHTVIASIDKDLLQIPGYHYNLNSRMETEVTEREGFRNFAKQLLTGDVTDNVPGLVKLLKIRGREAEANQLAHHRYVKQYEEDCLDSTPQECYDYVLRMYQTKGFSEAEVGEIFNLLWLRRYPSQNGFEDFKNANKMPG